MAHEAEQDESVLMQVAVKQVNRLNKAVNRYRIFVIILAVVCAALVAGGGLLAKTYLDAESALHHQNQVSQSLAALIRKQGQENYQSCLSGNSFRSGNQQIWTYLFSLISNGKPNPDQPLVTKFLGYVAKVEKLRDCKPLLSAEGSATPGP
jgi:hypothetical protein